MLVSDVSMANIRLELAQDDAAQVHEDAMASSQPAISAFLLLGLRIEGLQ